MEKEYKIHAFYILTILVVTIVILVSVEWSTIPRLVDYIAFALTMSSLILATLAIVYSIYSNSSLATLLGEVSQASREIDRASRDLADSNAELRSEFSKLPKRFDLVDANLAETKEIIKEYAVSGELEQKRSVQPESVDIQAEIPTELIDKFLDKSSVRGLEMLLMASLSHKSNTAFKFSEIKDKYSEYAGTEDYFVAYMVASASLGLCGYSHDAQQRLSFSYVHPRVLDRIEEIIVKTVTVIAKEMAADFEEDEKESIDRWLIGPKAIAEFFGQKLSI